MKKFKFALAPVLSLRETKENKIKMQYAAKIQQIIEASTVQADIINQLKSFQESEKKNRVDVTNAMMLRYSVAHRFKLKQDLLNISRKIDDLNAEAFKIQKLLIAATKDKRAIEIIKEKQICEWKKEYRSYEQGFIDDISQQNYIRNSRSNRDSL